jgi:hypothetical protein
MGLSKQRPRVAITTAGCEYTIPISDLRISNFELFFDLNFDYFQICNSMIATRNPQFEIRLDRSARWPVGCEAAQSRSNRGVRIIRST